jgi:para-nitrobenzyl esterase
MRRVIFGALVLLSACTLTRSNWRNVDARADQSTLRSLETGDVIGFIEPEGTVAWLGVPYGEPPMGPLRWKATVPAKKRDVFVYSATKYGPECPQVATDGGVDGDEACLTLNISARSLTEEKQPVMVWIHGGGNTTGTANQYGVMRNISRRYGVVVVSVNYRLGVLGWFHHPALVSALDSQDDASGNYGTLDQITALEWVRDNISKFGGDPNNVTLFGEGSGGSNIFALLRSPRAKGLFHRAAIENGRPDTDTFEQALHFSDDGGNANSSNEVLLQQLILDKRSTDRESAKTLLASLRESDIANYLRSRTITQLLTPMTTWPYGTYATPQLLRDGHVLTDELTDVPVILGIDRFQFMSGRLDSRFGAPRESPNHAYGRDLRFRLSIAKERGVDAPADAMKTAFLYRFDWHEPAGIPVDAALTCLAESFDVGFIMGDEVGEADCLHLYSDENEAGRVKLSRTMMSYWAQFARTGNPGRGVDNTLSEWKPATAEHEFMIFDTELRMEKGRETLNAIEERVWNSPEFSDDAERCLTMERLFNSQRCPKK